MGGVPEYLDIRGSVRGLAPYRACAQSQSERIGCLCRILARVVQHENDHPGGILFFDRMRRSSRRRF
jgi:peptide deformylase